jgi:uncharacterized membrane protein YhaH (DUF805 family)
VAYERYNQPLIERRAFLWRWLRHMLLAVVILGGSLLVGICGYMQFAGLSAIDAFVNSAMLLGGMGPVDPLPNDNAKIFAGLYALYAGIVFLVAVAVVAAPAIHRFLHKLNLDEPDDEPSKENDAG